MKLKILLTEAHSSLPQPTLTRLPEKDGAANTGSPVSVSVTLRGRENADSGNWLMHLMSKILVTTENH